MIDLPPLVIGLLSVVALAACEGGDTQFTAKFASDFAPARHTVSVLGAYQDGRISSDAWESLSHPLLPALRATRCDLGYDALVAHEDVRLDAADQAGGRGLSPQALAKLAPAAQGDLVLVLKLGGRVPDSDRVIAKMGEMPPSQLPSALGHRVGPRAGGMPGRGSLANSPRSDGVVESRVLDASVLDLSATFYSVAQARVVAMLSMQYSGDSLEEASEEFAAKIARSFPEMTCVGWNMEAPPESPTPGVPEAL